jgi:hypothetical protein
LMSRNESFMRCSLRGERPPPCPRRAAPNAGAEGSLSAMVVYREAPCSARHSRCVKPTDAHRPFGGVHRGDAEPVTPMAGGARCTNRSRSGVGTSASRRNGYSGALAARVRDGA